MSVALTVIFGVAGFMFVAGAFFTLYRMVRGGSILDRMIASDVLVITLMLVLGAEMVVNGHTRTIPVMLVISALAMVSTVAVARYVSKHDRTPVDGPPDDSAEEAAGEPVSAEGALAEGDATVMRSEPLQ